MNHHCVQRILHLVRNAGSDATQSGELVRIIELRLELLERVEVAKADDSAYRLAFIFDVLNRSEYLARPESVLIDEHYMFERAVRLLHAIDQFDERMVRAYDVVEFRSGQIYSRNPEQVIDFRAHQHHTLFRVEQHESLFDVAQNLREPSASHLKFGAFTREPSPYDLKLV